MKLTSAQWNPFTANFWVGRADSRPSSLFRILLGLLLLKDAIYHLFLAELYYSDIGLVPRSVLPEVYRTSNTFSLMNGLSEAWQAQLFFSAWIVVIVLLMLGIHARWMAVLNFILVVSVQERNPFILDGADTVMRVMSLWLIFLPLADYYSFDAWHKRWQRAGRSQSISILRTPSVPHTAFAFPYRLAQLQVGIIYLSAFFSKLVGESWRNGEALYQAIQLKTFQMPVIGGLFANYAPYWLLEALTYYTLAFEGLFIFMVFSPFFQPRLRRAALIAGILFHGGIAVLMAIPNFSVVMVSLYVLFLENGEIERFFMAFKRKPQPLTLPRPPDAHPLWVVLSLTPASAIQLSTSRQTTSSMDEWEVETDTGETLRGQAAWQATAAHLPFNRFWLWVLQFRQVRRSLWNALRYIRGQFPALDGTLRPLIEWQPSWLLHAAGRSVLVIQLGILIWIIISSGLTDLKVFGEAVIPPIRGQSFTVGQTLGINNRWGMFAPYPVSHYSWYMIAGTFEDGTHFDLITGNPIQPDQITHWRFGPFGRSRKYYENVSNRDYEELLAPHAAYYCRRYNITERRPVGQRLAYLQIQERWQDNINYAEPLTPYQTTIRWRHWCYDQYREAALTD
jgi:hypothetical protein